MGHRAAKHSLIGGGGHDPHLYQKTSVYPPLLLMITQNITTLLANKLREKLTFFILNLKVTIISERCIIG